MKKNILTIIILFNTVNIFAQEYTPSYPQVLRQFFYTYSADENPIDSYLNFAKRKDGWYVQKIDQLNKNAVLSEAPFWTLKDKVFENLDTMFEVGYYEKTAEENISLYLSGNVIYQWKEYERCRYAGYIGWEEDMIHDFGNMQSLPDTLLEGLARAYSSKASSYLWFPAEKGPGNSDSLQRQLGLVELPSKERINRVLELIAKSVETFDKLLIQNPAYNTTVGNIYVKKFNEYMHGYNLMIMAMQDEKARKLLLKAELTEPYIAQAKNYLNSCDKNAILFTYGDNDTYQLWYVQEKENYRKDVTVINNSLLGLPIYIDMLKKRKLVNFSIPLSYYSMPGNSLSSYKPFKDSSRNKEIDVSIFLKNVFSKKQSSESFGFNGDVQLNSVYENDKVRLPLNNNAFNKLSAIKTNANKISFALTKYTYISDLVIFDIANENINTRPICFTTAYPGHFDDDLIQQGIVYRLFPMEKTDKQMITKKTIRALEKFADSIYEPVTTFTMNGQKNISYDGNNAFFFLNSAIADYYCDNNNIPAAAAQLKKAEVILTGVTIDNMPPATALLNSYFKIDIGKVKHYTEIYSQYLYDKYAHPTSLNGYLSKDKCTESIHRYYDFMKSKGIESDVIETLLNELEKN
ncbi:MAG: hypothetical protein ABIN36_12810 [Ferruginibacter sp.]